MASSWLPRVKLHFHQHDSAQYKVRSRPIPLRMRTFSDSGPWSPNIGEHREAWHTRNKSAVDNSELSPGSRKGRADATQTPLRVDSPRASLDASACDSLSSSSESPETPETGLHSGRVSLEMADPEVLLYDFTKIDYDIVRATLLGKGLWSIVYLAEQKSTTPVNAIDSPRSPTRSRRQPRSGSALFAIKTPARKDSHPIFRK